MDMMEIRRRMLSVDRELPPQYQRVEYIQSSGSQYIKINDNFNAGVLFELVCQLDSVSKTQVVVGQSARGGYWFGCDPTNLYDVGSTKTSIQIGNKNKILLRYATARLYGTIDGQNINGGDYVTTGPRELTIFGAQGTSAWFYSWAKIFSFRADGVVNLIPCYRISDGTIGMYDTVTRRFLTNSGSGTFTKGRDIH